MNAPPEPPPSPRRGTGPALLARLVLTLALAWITTGALFKLLEGSPNDLPKLVHGFLAGTLGIGPKFRLAIGVELAVALTALLRPRLGWLLVALQLLVFDLVLVPSLGDASCGCFGSRITIPPPVMMAIDSTLLLCVLATRPWRGVWGPRAPWSAAVIAVALGLSLPWLYDRQAHGGPEPAGTVAGTVAGGGGQGEATARKWVEFPLARWKGMLVHDTPLARYLDPNSLPDTGVYVLWRWTCDHCAKHLAYLAHHEKGDRMIALIRLTSPNDNEANRAVFEMPTGPNVVRVKLPEDTDYVVTAPGELVVEGYTIVSGKEGVETPDDEAPADGAGGR